MELDQCQVQGFEEQVTLHIPENVVIVMRKWLWEFIFSGLMFWLAIRLHLKIINILVYIFFNVAYFYSGFSIKICMQSDSGYTCNPLQVLLNTNITRVLKIPCAWMVLLSLEEQSPYDCQWFT